MAMQQDIRQVADITTDIREARRSLHAEMHARDKLAHAPDSELERRQITTSIHSIEQHIADLEAEREEARRYWR